MVFYWFANDTVLFVLDMMFYVSPMAIIQFLILSRLLRLCAWHRTACVLPLIPQAMVFLDKVYFQFSENLAEVCVATISVMSIILLFAAYKVFLK